MVRRPGLSRWALPCGVWFGAWLGLGFVRLGEASDFCFAGALGLLPWGAHWVQDGLLSWDFLALEGCLVVLVHPLLNGGVLWR
eukprot:m.208586 g.208586  ORF g.208586 m.208586 type:complete len:83 (+) comp39711_c0_seq2:200-448(+)